MNIIGIDPGLTGAVAVYNSGTLTVLDMPRIENDINALELYRIINQHLGPGPGSTIAYIERVGPMPRDGVKQAWRFSAAYTTTRVVLALLYVPMALVPATVWKRAYKLPGGARGKDASRARAIELFPRCASQFARRKDSGRAEAALIALYGALLQKTDVAAQAIYGAIPLQAGK